MDVSVADALVGVVVGGCALVAGRRRRSTGALLGVVAVTWFAADVGAVAGVLGELGRRTALLHRAVLGHAVIELEGRSRPGRPRLMAGAVVTAGYVSALGPAWARNGLSVLAVATLAAVWGLRSDHRSGLAPLVALGATIAVAALATATGSDVARIAYRVGVAATAVAVGRRAIAVPDLDRVVDATGPIGERTDPRLPATVGFLDDDGVVRSVSGEVVDRATGDEVVEIDVGSGATAIVICHDPLLADPAVRGDLAAAVRLLAENRALLADAHARTAELQESRRRLVDAAERARLGLSVDVAERVSTRLAAVESLAAGSGVGPTLDDVRNEIDALASGLAPPALANGVTAALQQLVASAAPTVPVDLVVTEPLDDDDIDPLVARGAYLAAAELITNAVRHGGGAPIRVRMRRTRSVLELRVDDAGPGGARSGPGSGLDGLRDRIGALGGSLTIDSPPGAGTRATVRLPVVDASGPR